MGEGRDSTASGVRAADRQTVSQDRAVLRVDVGLDQTARGPEDHSLGGVQDSIVIGVRTADRQTVSQDREIATVDAVSDPMASVPKDRCLNAGRKRNVIEVRETMAGNARHRTDRSRNAIPNSV